MWWLLTASSLAGEVIRDVEFGLKGEIPLVATASITESTDGQGDSQLHVGWEGWAALAVTPRWWVTTTLGTRRQYLMYPVDDGTPPILQTRAMRLYGGLRVSFLDAPTFLNLNVAGGWCSSWWRVELGGANGDRRAGGLGGYASVGVDRFLNPRFAVGVELRGWGEQHAQESMRLDSAEAEAGRDEVREWAFTHSPNQTGISLLATVTFR